ncbi:hypothetical protein GYMLUDRAFT_252725 [Collybiopsis luxurians FD-317 M1]|uniref:Unplaced genomic scaffold GYMLUscaffold_139, whole genome shotgun sequence n=1 Tax=Collybiopsis luxurians FD-317 M1 TaxID=944289 RepID=A0A0D0BMM8_9AGAR|nr:hypothetical protein GYMLUDRAFT_252725 [Collybiopsis luxurians FD-317 M1]
MIPPSIPDLQPSWNEAEVKAAKDSAKLWLDGDKKALAIIAKAVPAAKLYLIEECTSAHAAWKALQSEYEPHNTLSALTIMQQTISNQCQLGNNPVAWLEVMIQLYSCLQATDPKIG